MSTPHPLEEASQQDASATGYWDPWEGPAQPHWYSGLLEAPFEGLGTGAAKGEAVLGGLVHLAGRLYGSVGKPRVVGQEIAPIGASIQQDARERVKDMTPDPGTVGTAANVLHGVGEGAELFALGGAGATGALAVGAGEGFGRYQELREHGVERAAAAEAGGLTAVTGTAGAMVPGGFGSTFLTRLLTGAAANTTFGVANRYGDHLILDANGYHEMADQQRVLDGTQLVADAVLGATFGVLHHLGAPDERRQDAARTAALALQDRRAAPGVPVDPQAAGAHQAALEAATEQLMQGKPVDVADSGVEGATFARRPAPDTAEPLAMMADALKESGFLGEELSLHDLEGQLEERQGAAPRVAEHPVEQEVRPPEEAKASGDPVSRALAERPNMELPTAEPGAEAVREKLGELFTRATKRQAMEEHGQGILDEMEEAGETPREVSEKFWNDTYPQLGPEGRKLFEDQARALGFEPGDVSHTEADGTEVKLADWPAVGRFLAEDMPSVEHLEGSQRGFIASMKYANERSEKASTEPAHAALDRVNGEVKTITHEAPTAVKAAVGCYARRGT